MIRTGCGLLASAAVLFAWAVAAPAQESGRAREAACACCMPPRGTGAWEDRLWEADGQVARGQYGAALRILEGLTEEAGEFGGKEIPARIALFNLMGGAYQGVGRFLEAEQSFRRVLMLVENAGVRDEPCIFGTLNQLMMLYLASGQHDKAESTARRIEDTFATAHAVQDEEYFAFWNRRAILHIARGRCAAAHDVLTPALREAERKFGPEHPILAALLNTSGMNAARQKNWLEAIRFYERAAKINVTVNGPEHPDSGRVLSNLAGAYGHAGLTREADDAFREACRIIESQLGPDHPDLAGALASRALVLREMHRAREAKTLERRARAIVAASEAANLLNQTVDVRSLRSQGDP